MSPFNLTTVLESVAAANPDRAAFIGMGGAIHCDGQMRLSIGMFAAIFRSFRDRRTGT
jgi:hypothetical protein